MRLILNIILISIAILACFVADIYLYLWPPQKNQAIYLTIRSQGNFSFDQRTALDVKRKDALSRYIPIYRFDAQGLETSLEKFKAIMQEVSTFQEKKQKGSRPHLFQGTGKCRRCVYPEPGEGGAGNS